MADNWWDSSSRARPCLDSVSSVSVTSINLFQDSDTTNAAATTTAGGGSGGGGILGSDPTLHMMGLGLSSQPSLDWNQTLFGRGDHKSDQSGYRNLLQEDHSNTSTNYNQLENNQQWRSQKMYSGSSQDSSSDFKQINVRGFQLDQPDNNIIACQGLNSSFPNIDSYGSPSTIIQTLFGSDCNQQQQQQEQDSGFNQNQGMSYSSYQSSYGGMNMPGGGGGGGELSPSNWSKYPPPAQDFSVNSPPKVQPPGGGSQIHFSNNARFWNASVAPMNDARTSFFPSLQMQSPSSTTFDDKPKITSEMVKKSSSESSSTKRPRNENQSPLPAFKVRKEKMGDRITALQQLVSPFGKTDTASVLSEAIEYIKFLHEQVGVLSTPYMKNGAPVMQQQQQATTDISSEGGRQDLRSRGLCLVPVSSTFPVTHETTVDFWTPTFGGTFR